MIYVNNAELEKIFGSSSNITFSTVQVESILYNFADSLISNHRPSSIKVLFVSIACLGDRTTLSRGKGQPVVMTGQPCVSGVNMSKIDELLMFEARDTTFF